MEKMIVKTFNLFVINILLLTCFTTTEAAIFVVDNTTDIDNAATYTLADGTNSLRKCIRISNSTAGADVINFNIGGAGPFTIIISAGDLPSIVQQLTINGLSQSGASAGNLMIEINAAAAGNGLTFDNGSANSIISGICINRSNRGIYVVNTSAVTIQACYTGTDITGKIARPCNWNGIQVDSSPDVVIGGNSGITTRNIISGTSQVGIRVDNSPRILINGNYIGVDATGSVAMPNLGNGIQFVSPCNNSVIGNGLAGGGNVISGNGQSGMYIQSSLSLSIQGNYIGTDYTGSLKIGNQQNGIAVYSGSNNLIVGGAAAGQGNVVSANGQNGVYVESSLTPSFYGNIVGLNAIGTDTLPNKQSGIFINANSNNPTIGGSTVAQRNIVSGNLNSGIYILQSTSPVLYGNYIGTDITGTINYGNTQNGISIYNVSSNPIIGGSIAGQGNLISGNGQQGLSIDNSTTPIIKGNIIGLTSTASAIMANGYNGIYITNSSSPTIGGTSAIERNIVSGNKQSGMVVISCATPTILGNYVGVDITGSVNLGNAQQGIDVEVLNGAVIGNGTLAGMNIVSGNGFNGMNINAATNTIIQGNIVGTNISGLISLGNGQNGINIGNVSSNPIVGGAIAGQGNLVSGNGGSGIYFNNSINPIVKGNIVGMASNGTTVIANLQAGIAMFNGCNNPVVGGASLPERNLISGNKQIGLHINASISPIIYGNYIGTDVTGLLNKGNGESGIYIDGGSTNAIIGSTTLGTNNLISGNAINGIFILNSANATIKSNIIGLGIDGITAIGNLGGGIDNESSNNLVVGGTTIPERNLISSNSWFGVLVNNSLNAIVKANYIGVDISGMLPRGNGEHGVELITSNAALIGGSTLSEGNIISNNGGDGVNINTSTDVVVKACIIGLASDITTAAPNLQGGIGAYSGSHRLIVGGVLIAERNYISSNTGNGITVNSSDDISLVNNYVGVEVTGLIARPNTGNGASIEISNRAIVGGTTTTARNIFSANGANGIEIVTQSVDAVVKANYMGVGSDGVTLLGNTDNGLYMGDSSNHATIGGSTIAERNILSGNGTSGVGDGLRSVSCSRHVILGNYCGVDISGTIVLPNAWAGISLNEGNASIVGGTGSLDGNICSGNMHEGVYYRNATNTILIGNFIGTDRTGTLQLGNKNWQVNIRAISLNNLIGGSLAKANTIAYGKNIAGNGDGVFVEGGSQYNTITYNKIYCNAGLGIDLNGAANESIAAPVIMSSTANQISGTGSINGDPIHVYLNTTTGTGCNCEGEQFIGTTVVAGGAWTLVHGLGLSNAQAGNLTATETTALGSTSDFSNCLVPLPVTIISFTAQKLNDHTAVLEWQTGNEKNNDYFIIERSSDGINFESIGTIKGAGSSTNFLSYSFTDENPFQDINYYRLKQVDFNGQSENSVIRIVNFGASALALVSNGLDYYITVSSNENIQVNYTIYSAEGREVRTGNSVMGGNIKKALLDLSGLSTAVYYIKINAGENFIADKLFVK
jgi:hypothetical protein